MIMLKRESHHLATISPAFQQALSALRKLFVFNMQLLLCSSRMHSCSLGSLCQQSPDHLLSSTYNITVYIYIYTYITEFCQGSHRIALQRHPHAERIPEGRR